MTTLHDFGSVLGQPLDIFSGLSQFHGHCFWLMCEVALSLLKLIASRLAYDQRNQCMQREC